MDGKIFRMLIYLFGGLIVMFGLLILVNYIGSLTGERAELPGQETEGGDSAEAMAQRAIASARYSSAGNRASVIPSSRAGLSTAAVVSEGAIRIVKDSNFNGVAEKPKGMMEMLNDLGGGSKKKPAPIQLSDADLDRKLRSLGGSGETRLKTSAMPELGRGAGNEGVTLLSAPVDYKIFKSSETWWAFANSRKFMPEPHDFSSRDLLILVSVSEFPSGIFSVAAVEPGARETLVKYRVNPLAMSSEASKEERERYASAPVPRGKPVRLEQVP